VRFTVSSTFVSSNLRFAAPVGSAALPSYLFTGVGGSGFFAGTGYLGVSTNAVERFRFADATHTSTVPILLPGAPTLPLQAATKGYVDSAVAAGGGGAAITVTADTPPPTPVDGTQWYDTAALRLMIYYDDGTSSQWVDASPASVGITQADADLRYLGLAGGALTGALLLPDGTALLPSLTFASDTDTGLYKSAAGTIGLAGDGVLVMSIITGLATTLGRHRFSNGNATNPSLGFTADTNTGFWWPGADIIGFTTGGVECLRIAGTTAPVASQQVNNMLETLTLNLGATDTLNALMVGHQMTVAVNSTGGKLTGAGHAIGMQTNLNITTSGAATHTLMIAQEAAFSVTGTAGTISLLNGHVVHPSGIQGIVSQMTGYHVELANTDIDPAATVVVMIDYNSPNVSAVTKLPLLRYSLWNQDPGKTIRSDGIMLLASGQEAAPAQHLGVATGRYYYGMAPSNALTPVALSANLIYYTPTSIPKRTTLTKIGCRVTTAAAAGANIQMAIYKAVNGIPSGAALVTTASIVATTTGDKEATISLILEPGTYLFAVISNNTPTINWFTDYLLGVAAGTTTSTGGESTMVSAQTFGTWPSSPAVAWSNVVGASPMIWWRA
jgi:hypothetical protein